MTDWYTYHGACPDCGTKLELRSGNRCGCGFSIREGEPLDLRPQSPHPRTRTVRLGSTEAEALSRVDIARPPITYRAPSGIRDSSELFSAAAPFLARGGRLLDLGCGPRDQALPAEYFGLQYVGIDFSSPKADLHADAHAIPFESSLFDAVVSYAVLEHLYNPFEAVAEVARVLRPRGVFFGAVSQGEPFHESFFHHTAFGTMSVLVRSGFEVLRLWPSYDTLHALSQMGRYPRAIRILIELVNRLDRGLPILAPRAFFTNSPHQKDLERLHRAASICFLARSTGSAS